MRQVALIIFFVVISVSAVVLVFAYFQVQDERATLVADLQYRTHLLADGLKESVEPSFANYSTSTLQGIVDRFANRERLVGLALYDSEANLIVASEDLPSQAGARASLAARVMDQDEVAGEFVNTERGSTD